MNTSFKKSFIISLVLLIVLFLSSCDWSEEKTKEKEAKSDKELILHLADSKKSDKEIKNENNIVKYKDLYEFISPTLSSDEDAEILLILKQRVKCREVQIKDVLIKAVEDWNLEEKLEDVRELRETCANRILPYVSEDKKDAFIIYSEKWNDSLRDKYTKMFNDNKKSKYKDLSGFISITLSEEENKEVLLILEQRSSRQLEVKEILKKAVTDWNLEEKFVEVKEIRKTCANRILPYISEDKKEAFIAYCEKWNDVLKNQFTNIDGDIADCPCAG